MHPGRIGIDSRTRPQHVCLAAAALPPLPHKEDLVPALTAMDKALHEFFNYWRALRDSARERLHMGLEFSSSVGFMFFDYLLLPVLPSGCTTESACYPI